MEPFFFIIERSSDFSYYCTRCSLISFCPFKEWCGCNILPIQLLKMKNKTHFPQQEISLYTKQNVFLPDSKKEGFKQRRRETKFRKDCWRSLCRKGLSRIATDIDWTICCPHFCSVTQIIYFITASINLSEHYQNSILSHLVCSDHASERA